MTRAARTLRAPAPLLERLDVVAKRNGRSANAETVHALERHVAANEALEARKRRRSNLPAVSST